MSKLVDQVDIEYNPLLDPNADERAKIEYFNNKYRDRELFSKRNIFMGVVRGFDENALILDSGRINFDGLRNNFYYTKQ